MPRVRLFQDLAERLFRLARVCAAQHVVGAEFDDHRIRPLGNAPIKSSEAARGGVAGNAGVGDLDVQSLRFQRSLQGVGKRLAGRQSLTGGEAVAERDDAQRPRLRDRREGQRDQQREGQRSEARLDAAQIMPI